MPVFTTLSKAPISWEAPPPDETTGEAYELLIGSGFKINIGSGFNLTVQPAKVDIVWTEVVKSSGSNTWPTITGSFGLNIGSGFNLLVDNENILLISDDGPRTPRTDLWEPVSKNSIPTY